MHDYLNTLLEPEFLVTLPGRFTAGGKARNRLSPTPPTPEQLDARQRQRGARSL